jgi:tetratricopeptide (TPR) repeat protein
MRNLLYPLLLSSSLFALSGESSMSMAMYKGLNKVKTYIAEDAPKRAIELLDDLKINTDERAHYNLAFLYQSYATYYLQEGNYQKAIDAYTKALSYKLFPPKMQIAIQYTIAKLNISLANYKASAHWFEIWLKEVKTPTKEGYYLLSVSYLQEEHYLKAIPYLKKAISLSKEPNKAWYNMLLASYYALENSQEIEKLLEHLIALFPDDDTFWKRYLNSTLIKEEQAKSLAILTLMYHNNSLSQSSQWLTMVRLHLALQTPKSAATILSKALKEKSVKKSYISYKLLFDAYYMAREYQEALKALEEATHYTKDPKTAINLLKLYLAQEEYQNVISKSEKLNLFESEKNEEIHLYCAIAYYHLKKFSKAKTALKAIQKDQKLVKKREDWSRLIDQKERSL